MPHFRVRSLIDVGAWDEWNVTEDADLGIRLARFGYKVRALDSDTSEEAPGELKKLVPAARPLAKGVDADPNRPLAAAELLPQRPGRKAGAAATTLIGGAIVGCLFWPAFALLTLWRALTVGDDGALAPAREMSDVFTYILALSGAWAIALPAVIAARLRGSNLSLRTIALMPAYYVLICAATWAAVLHLVLWPYYWGKTDHGRARRRPTAPVARPRLSR